MIGRKVNKTVSTNQTEMCHVNDSQESIEALYLF